MKIFQPRFLLIMVLILLSSCTERRQGLLLEKAESLTNEGKYLEASEVLREAIGMNPDTRTAVKAYYRLGFTLETYLKDFQGAVENYQGYLDHSGDAVSVYEVQKRIANIYFEQLLDYQKTIEGYKKLLLISPESLEADFFHYRIAQSQFRLSRFGESRSAYQKLLEGFPKSQYSARARFGIGNTYYMEGRYGVALEALKQVLRQHPNSEYAIESQFLMAQSLEHQGKLEGAQQMYESLKGKYLVEEVLDLRIKETAKRLRLKSKK